MPRRRNFRGGLMKCKTTTTTTSGMNRIRNVVHRLAFLIGVVVIIINVFFFTRATVQRFDQQERQHHKSLYRTQRSLSDCPYPVITLFTSFVNSWQRKIIQENVLKMWPEMGSDVKLVLFKENSDHKGFVDILAQQAQALKWDVLPVNRTNPHGTPILKDMFITVMQRYPSTFYGYANGDILFTEHLPRTLRAVSCELKRLNSTFIIGRRRNYENPRGRPQLITSPQTILTTMLKASSLHRADAIDYFITTRDGFKWSTIPDFVIGRPGYDNYLVAKAVETSSVIDCSSTVLALHQNPAGALASKQRENRDEHWNELIIKKADPSFKYEDGNITRAQYETTRDISGKICVKVKPPPPPPATPAPDKKPATDKSSKTLAKQTPKHEPKKANKN